MTDTSPTVLSPEIRALIIKAFIGEAQKELDAITEKVAIAYPLPTTVPFESPLDGSPLGHINRARKTPEWKVTSLEQLTEHFTREFPAAMETVYLLDVPGVAAPAVLPEDHPLTQALLGAAPELLTPQRRVPPDVVEAALQESRDKGQAAAPGIQLVRGGQGALSVVYDKKQAVPAIGRLIATGGMRWSEVVGASPLALPARPVEAEAS